MHINLEAPNKFAVQAYSDTEIKIDEQCYQHSLLVSKHGVLTYWPIQHIHELKDPLLDAILNYKPEIIIIGHASIGQYAPMETKSLLLSKRIGFECMSMGAASRTYNILLSEHREVVLGLIF